MVRVTVLYFSNLRLALGIDREQVELPERTTATAILEAISRVHPAHAQEVSAARLAVNQAFAAGEVVLHEGAELAVITPVSGG